MTGVIAVLLALILVALVSSNRGSADRVKKVLAYSCGFGLFLLSWAILIGYILWFNEMTKAGTSSSAIGLGIAVIGYPVLL